ncbi:ubiquitin carboxyl-terminal hydrolase MINDY-3 homolog isoform X3 [Homalodisca vitripennis]|uniref:ubiquitin carboxyl-terminal hydrolase MINDY-3 homolog isoform X2 n=1 Tax=Homalodisca vitripennis TaxID=197043 RepID=UPI001EEAD329|nr:ubiquitin carboxyl-terminal hydrolase MINDY-3 homolog isoform X2 [Homalodisca vitripennis]XP_046672889.1 ubiquitin carboxyl-terminal hydrolase MINDY-3 homolog isoform X3 [Homalodisca vitripennis]
MASNVSDDGPNSELNEIIKLMWGSNVKEDVFQRWTQGFHFSADEPTALVQWEGGPCAVLAPVQAFILKSLVSETWTSNWREMEVEGVNRLLIRAACEILCQAYGGQKYHLVHMNDQDQLSNSEVTDQTPENSQNTTQEPKLNHSYFHSQLRVHSVDSSDEVEAFYLERIQMLRETFGVLLFLYSVMYTKGLEQLHTEVTDPGEPMIDGEYGYGSQCLINLMITGRAVAHVWNHDQDVGGLKLLGIDKQSTVGFLALLEHLRYCEVGSFLKNPMTPVWVLGSETHLTVLFSFEKQLVSAETPTEVARRVFKSFDPEGNNFISSDLLQDVLSMLNLVSDPEYVEIMKKKLDADSLGIILLSAFMEEFFPEETISVPDTFTLYHYNGLPRSCPNNKVVYQEGSAVLLECNMKCVLDSNPMLTCLHTMSEYYCQ